MPETIEQPQTTGTQDAPAVQADTPAKEPTPQAPDTRALSQAAAAKERQKTHTENARKAVLERFNGIPAPKATEKAVSEPGAAASTTPTPSEKPAAESPAPNPDKEKPAPAAPAAASAKKDVVTLKDGDKDIDVTVDMARTAILRDGVTPALLAKMSKAEIMEYGAKRFLAQRKQDQFGIQARDWRSAAEGARQKSAQTPGDTAAAPSQPPSAATSQPADKSATGKETAAPAQPSQPASDLSHMVKLTLEDDLKSFADVAGEDVAAQAKPLLEKVANSVFQQAQTLMAQQSETFHQQLEQQKQAVSNLAQMHLQGLYDQEFSRLESDFPQVKDPAVRTQIQQYADAIARSGRFENPWSSFKTIVEEASYACLGNQKRETEARQQLARQQRRANNQVDTGPSKTDAPTGSMSDKDIKLTAQRMLTEGKTSDQVREYVRSVRAASHA